MAKGPLHWLDVDEIGERLHAAHPTVDPLTLRFTKLREMVLALPGFAPQAEHPVNEKILETIQQRWHEEREDGPPRDED